LVRGHQLARVAKKSQYGWIEYGPATALRRWPATEKGSTALGVTIRGEIVSSGLIACLVQRMLRLLTITRSGYGNHRYSSWIMNGTPGVTGDAALPLALFFGTSAQFWFNFTASP
jgi:plasmid maintenance system antidote protein VapI